MLPFGMLSLENIAAVKVAVEICNNPELKREIICALESYYEAKREEDQYCFKKQKGTVEKKAIVIVENLSIAQQLQEKVRAILLLVGERMLAWAEYHERTLGLSREYSINILNSSFFTQRGIIDNKRVAEDLLSDKNLSIVQKYKTACLYCFTDHISALYIQMKDDKDKFCSAGPQWIIQPGLVTFWSDYLMGKVDEIRGGKTVDQYRLEKAVQSGSKEAVEYCLEKTNLRWEKDAIVDAAVETVRNWGKASDDWFNFRYSRCSLVQKALVPCDYYVDIISYLLPMMTENQQIEFLKRDIECYIYVGEELIDPGHSRVLEYFLSWPYQDYFMKTAELMWEFLPEKDYAILLLKVCDKIESETEKNLKYAEAKTYDYRGLLKEFWCQSPERYKRFVFSNQEVDYTDDRTDRNVRVKAGAGLLTKLLTLKNFTNEDEKNIKLIIDSATDEEKEIINSYEEWKSICFRLMEVEEWDRLDEFVLFRYSSVEKANEFKRELIFTKEAQRVCIYFVKNDKLNTAESIIKWSSLHENEINQLKKELISSNGGMRACVGLILYDKNKESFDRFIRWCFSSEEEVKAFKKDLVFSDHGTDKCGDLLTKDKLDIVSEFVNLCLSSEEEVREFKKKVANRYLGAVWVKYYSDSEVEEIFDDGGPEIFRKIIFKAGMWEDVEKILTWCFSSEEEINDFKKNVLLKESGKEIHFSFIESNQWEEAETFFAWLGLSSEEIKELKKETLFHHDEASEMFFDLMYSEEGDFVDYGGKQAAIELLLRWYLTDKETVLEFKDHFKERYNREEITQYDRDVLKNFDLAITQRLSDLEEEQRCVKRKSEAFPLNKRLCN